MPGECMCKPDRRYKATPAKRERNICVPLPVSAMLDVRRARVHALMSSRQAHALTPNISTTRMKTGTNTLTDTSSPAIPPIA